MDQEGYRSSEDEDYAPENDVVELEEAKLDAKEEYGKKWDGLEEPGKQRNKEIRQQKVDKTWQELDLISKVSEKAKLKSEKILKSGKTKAKKKRKIQEFKMPTLGIDPKKAQRPSGSLVSNRSKVEETVKFAGKEIRVSKSQTKTAASAASVLDSMVAAIQDPKKISTIEKSSLDWDNFKQKEGIDDELKQFTKDGYLEKQEFLQRVDLRKFEQEKKERDKKRNTK